MPGLSETMRCFDSDCENKRYWCNYEIDDDDKSNDINFAFDGNDDDTDDCSNVGDNGWY